MTQLDSLANLSKKASAALNRLRKNLGKLSGAVIAYSGGMDSGFLALVAREVLPDTCVAFLAVTEILGGNETAIALSLAERHHIPLRRFDLQVLPLPVFAEHPRDRCYHCKKHVFSTFVQACPKGWTLCDGTTLDDHTDDRPGHKAIAELGVKSPLDEAGFSKELIGEVLKAWGKSEFFRPAQACLATRIPFGTAVTRERIFQVESGETLLREAGFAGARFRHHGSVARIEVLPEQLVAAVQSLVSRVDQFKALGFSHITIDLEGYQRGSMNKTDETQKTSQQTS